MTKKETKATVSNTPHREEHLSFVTANKLSYISDSDMDPLHQLQTFKVALKLFCLCVFGWLAEKKDKKKAKQFLQDILTTGFAMFHSLLFCLFRQSK